MIENLGGRKFVISIIGIISMIAIILTVPELRQDAMNVIGWVITAYVGANAVTKLVGGGKE